MALKFFPRMKEYGISFTSIEFQSTSGVSLH